VSIRLVLADDHPIVLHGLQQLFARHGDFIVLAACSDGASALDAVKAQRPDVLVLDLRMSPRNGLDVLRALAKERIPCRTVLLTAAITDEEVVEAMRLGAMGLVLNRPLETTVGEAWTQVSSVPYPNEDPLFQGGPCEGPLIRIGRRDLWVAAAAPAWGGASRTGVRGRGRTRPHRGGDGRCAWGSARR
jgi:CheY-like chemotaxis protein